MIRRRRPERGEIPFSFDSFLDVVANVVGIVLRLILVAWVGAKSYKGPPLPPAPPPPAPLSALPDIMPPKPPSAADDPIAGDVLRERQELLRAQAELLALLKQQEQAPELVKQPKHDLDEVMARRRAIQGEIVLIDHSAVGQDDKNLATATLEELQARRQRLEQEIADMRKLPSARHELRYRTPISAPVLTRELTFECQHGRVTPVDIGGLLDFVDRRWREKRDVLRTQWDVIDQTPPSGAFSMRYTVARRREAGEMGGVGPSGPSFTFGPTLMEVVPVNPDRGETAEQALKAGSTFLKILSDADGETAVTFWVYADSFAVYRQLRDYLHDRDLVVAGRPLREGSLIRISPDGTASRGQ
jgi:hypothetical protein